MCEISRADGARVLVVEDDPSAARFAEYVLGALCGFAVTCTADPEMALGLLAGQPWDVVVADVELPRISGLGLLAAVREFAPDMPFVVMTASLTAERAAAARRLCADILLEKPVAPRRLAGAVAGLVAAARGRGDAAPPRNPAS